MLFKKTKQIPSEPSYDDVVEYLREMQQVHYAKILKVVNTYREADKKVKKILNIKDETIDLDEDIADLLIDDEPAPKATSKRSKS